MFLGLIGNFEDFLPFYLGAGSEFNRFCVTWLIFSALFPAQNKSRFPPKAPQGLCGPRRAGPAPRERLPPPDEEPAESLTAFLRSPGSPWALPADCSLADQRLRELAVQSPRVVRRSFIFCYFRSLRIVSKDVSEIDSGLLKFPNLEELILSANRISTINSANLPPTLKVLELCGNNVDGLRDLCAHPPPQLQHLGLGHNCRLGSSEEQYLTDAFWPKLVSLDLSYNSFTSLLSLLAHLLTLKQLRILVLQGNPCALLPGYRGFTIDSLPRLCALDDVLITLDERHSFLGLARNPELLRCRAKMIVTIGKIRGVPNPIGPEEPESGPESPVITYSYYVTYEFAEATLVPPQVLREGGSVSSFPGPPANWTAGPGVLLASKPCPHVAGSMGGVTGAATCRRLMPQLEGALWSCGRVPWPPSPPAANLHATPRKPWAETIECDYRKEHCAQDVAGLKAFLLAGTTVEVIEEKVARPARVLIRKGKPEKGKPEKGKPEKGKKDKEKEKGKGKDKKKKLPSPELRSDPPILKTLGSVRVALEGLLAGESLLETVCDFGVLAAEVHVQPPSPKEKVPDHRLNSELDCFASVCFPAVGAPAWLLLESDWTGSRVESRRQSPLGRDPVQGGAGQGRRALPRPPRWELQGFLRPFQHVTLLRALGSRADEVCSEVSPGAPVELKGSYFRGFQG
uniref:Leucine rich repeat containing 43 n=1 Tax=Varanus komodoensis TaxID=61221 RepID=A0A8D2Q709_VARKO